MMNKKVMGKERSILQVILSIALISIILVSMWSVKSYAESTKELISSGTLSDEFEIIIDEGICLQNIKPQYENNKLTFIGNLVNNTDKVVQVELTGKMVLKATNEEIEINFANEAGANSKVENVSINVDKELPNLDLNQSVNRSFKCNYELISDSKKDERSIDSNELLEREEKNIKKDIFLIVVPALCLIISYSIWSAFGRDTKIKSKEIHHPLKDTNSMEIAYLYQDKCDKNDIASLIVYLANLGYISIEETDLKDGYKNNVFKLKKLKEYDLKNSNEKLLMETLFNGEKEITTDRLGNSLSDIKKEIKRSMKEKYSDEKMYTKGEISRKIYVSILVIISVLVIMTIPKLGITTKLFGIKETIMLLVLLLFGIMPAFLDIQTKRAENLELYIYMAIDVLLTVTFMYFIRGAFLVNRHFYEAIISGAFVVVMLLLLYLMPKKKERYAEKYQKIADFKEFIENGKVDTIKKLIKEDSNYFYNILPYATSLELDNEWIIKSKDIVKSWPKWYKKKNEKYETEIFERKYRKLIQTLEFYAEFENE